MLITCILICLLNLKYNNNDNLIKYIVSKIFFLLSIIQYIVIIRLIKLTFFLYNYIKFIIIIDIILNTIIFFYYFLNCDNVNDNLDNNRINFNRRIINVRENTETNNFNRINRNNLLIQQKEEFECNICYNIDTYYYDIQCQNTDHIICEKCSKNILFNIKKCPWCNTNVNIIYNL